jgi:uncharacterized protein
MSPRFRLVALLLALPAGRLAAAVAPLPYQVPLASPDAIVPAEASAVRLDGWLGARIDANERNRLLVVDTVPLLAGYHHKPGEQAWIGEHVGKWLHAATLAWAYSGDPALRQKLDRVAAELIATQEPDGYLGTYVPDKRFGTYPDADWDVWTHAYNMIGLLAYYRYTGNAPALAAVRRIGDLLIATFPAKRSILAAGTHRGMAATSVLEPVVELYRVTGDPRYLAFARYLVGAYDEPGGPAIVTALLAGTGVDHIANGKAYEMLANLMGICDLARVTGDPRLLRAVTRAWDDITRNRLYVTGTASAFECFTGDHELPNANEDHLGETCVTTTWIQLNLELLSATGQAAYADEIERSLYNHLAAAQNPRGDDWCYYTALDGRKQYDAGITCCHSSGPRALALAPTAAYLQGGDTLYVSTFEPSRGDFVVGGAPVTLALESSFPAAGVATVVVRAGAPARFALRIRVPAWAAPLRIAGQDFGAGWATLPARTWHDGDRVPVRYTLGGRVIHGDYGNYGRLAFAWGPFVLAADTAHNPGIDGLEALRMAAGIAPTLVAAPGGLEFQVQSRGTWDRTLRRVDLVPFADAGAGGDSYRVWLRAGG